MDMLRVENYIDRIDAYAHPYIQRKMLKFNLLV